MSNYEFGDLIFTALNFIFMVGSAILGFYINKNKKDTEKNTEEIKKISKEIKKYRDSIIKSTHLIGLNRTLDGLKKISIRFSEIIDKEEKIRGYNPFNEYYILITEIKEVKQNIPSKYSDIEDQLDLVKRVLEEYKNKKNLLSKTDKWRDIDESIDNIIRDLKQETEKLGFK